MELVKYDVFISCKSEDYSKVEPIYHWLVEKGYRTFFSPISLRIPTIKGDSGVFGEEIDDALESADNMIVFTSNAEYVKTGYVKDEWRTFVEEQRSGRKSGSMVTILDGIDVADLPIRLRSVQSFTPSNYKQGILRCLGDVYEGEDIKKGDKTSLKTENERTFTVEGVSFKMIRVEGGSMGTFYIGETQVTQELWRAVMGDNPSYFKRSNFPVEQVSWNDICGRDGLGTYPNSFLYKLKKATGYAFRLPKEAEWKYAAQGGNRSRGYTYAGSNNIDEVAWYWKNSGNIYLDGGDDDWNYGKIKENKCRIHPVKTKLSNELGIYDMSGNVWEWCEDLYSPSGSYRVLRGGSWRSYMRFCHVANRNCSDADRRYYIIGFRLVLPL